MDLTLKQRISQNEGEKKRVPCRFLCGTNISCGVLKSGKNDEKNLRLHEKRCANNPERQAVSVAGLKVGESPLFGLIGSGAEFRAPSDVLARLQGSGKNTEGVIHCFPDNSFHHVVGKKNKTPFKISIFFYQGTRCCFPEDGSMLFFRKNPEKFPKMFDGEKFLVAELNNEQISGMPEPWTTSQLRLISLNAMCTIKATCTVCHKTIDMNVNSCAQGQGPCKFCSGINLGDLLPYDRSFQKYLDDKGLPWVTIPDARTIFRSGGDKVQMTCTLCNTTWGDRTPNNQYNCNSGCSGCSDNHRAERCAYTLYKNVLPDAEMRTQGQARLKDVHKNPFDVASTNYKIIFEIMSITYHVDKGKLPNDIEKMLAVLRKGYVYIMAHCEDFHQNPRRELAWKRCLAYALRQAGENPTPRVIHVRRDVAWTAYDSMRDAALAAEFGYQDVFCGDVNAHATERLPDETRGQTTLPWGAAAGASAPEAEAEAEVEVEASCTAPLAAAAARVAPTQLTLEAAFKRRKVGAATAGGQ